MFHRYSFSGMQDANVTSSNEEGQKWLRGWP